MAVADYLKKRPMLLCALISIAICIIGFYSEIFTFICGLLLLFVIFFLAKYKAKPAFITVAVLLALTVLSLLLTYGRIDKISAAGGSEVKGSFVVADSPENHGEYYSVTLEVKDCPRLENGTRILTFCKDGNIECGDIITASLKLKRVTGSYKASDYSNKVYLTAFASDVYVTDEGGDYVLSTANSLRNYISDTLFQNMGYNEASTLIAILSGDRSYITDEFYSCIKAAGVSHIMVVSGMHLAIIVSLILGIFEKFLYNRYLEAFVILVTVLFTATLCGFTKSIIRAGVCYLILAAGVILNRDNNPENTLGGAVSIILITNPFAVFSISFQLSVLSTLGIVAAALPVNKFIKEKGIFKGGFVNTVVSAITVSLAALLFTMPVAVYIFGYISTVSLPVNLLISYAVSLALSFAAVGLVLYAILPFAGVPFLYIAELIIRYVNFVIKSFGSLPFATVSLGRNAFIIPLILLLEIIAVLFIFKRREDMLRLKAMNYKIISEGGEKIKWR